MRTSKSLWNSNEYFCHEGRHNKFETVTIVRHTNFWSYFRQVKNMGASDNYTLTCRKQYGAIFVSEDHMRFDKVMVYYVKGAQEA